MNFIFDNLKKRLPPAGISILKKEFFRYFIISFIALVVDIAIFSFCIRIFSISWFFSSVMSFLAGVITTYFFSIRFVFATRLLQDNPSKEISLFTLIGVFGLGITQVVLLVGIDWLGFVPEIVKLLAAVVSFIFNFLIRKLFLFDKT
jgi:putative flippase GtrA